MFGLLNLDKPSGPTSRDVVNRVQRLVKPHKVGHAGTLDPLASGVLVVAVGAATRLVEYVQRMEKTYCGTFLLGRTSDTEDVQGEVVELAGAPVPTANQIRNVLPQFVGRIEQRPPAFSALKVAGQRAYDLARRGDDVELAARPVEVHSIDLLRFEYPELVLHIRCGSGTYVRSLGRDLARAVGTGAIMSGLRREAIGPFRAADSMQPDRLDAESIRRGLLPAGWAVSGMPQLEVDAAELLRLSQGQSIRNRLAIGGSEIAALDAAGNLAAILVPADEGLLRPTKCFVASASAS
jgi:tRNA pseudouridine55 synthase